MINMLMKRQNPEGKREQEQKTRDGELGGRSEAMGPGDNQEGVDAKPDRADG